MKMKLAFCAATLLAAAFLVVVVTSCRSTGEPPDGEELFASLQGELTAPVVYGWTTPPAGGGVDVLVRVEGVAPGGWEIDSVRAWIGSGGAAPAPGAGNPQLASPAKPPLPWPGRTIKQGFTGTVRTFVEVRMRAVGSTAFVKRTFETTSALTTTETPVPFKMDQIEIP